MPKRSSTPTTPPKEDFNQRAFRIVQELTSENKEDIAAALESKTVRKQVMQEMGSRGGKKGGKARAKSLTAKQRAEIAAIAAAARWKKGEV